MDARLGCYLDETGKKLDDLSAAADRIERAITHQNRAHFSAARLALRDGDLSEATQSLRLGISLDPFNAAAWGLYAETMLRRNNPQRTREIFGEMLSMFGGHCPAVPQPIRDAYTQHAEVTFQGAGEAKKELSKFTYGRSGWVGVSRQGLVVSVEYLKSATNSSVSTYFYPWKEDRCVILSQDRPTPNAAHFKDPIYPTYSLGTGWAERTLYSVTDRFAVFTDGTIVDLSKISENPSIRYITGENCSAKVSPADLPKIFGEPLFGVHSGTYNKPRGVEIVVSQNESRQSFPAGIIRSAHTEVEYRPEIVAKFVGGKVRAA